MRAGVAIIGSSSPQTDAIQLPAVDYATETVILREESHAHPATWLVTDGDTITIGSQGCAGGGDGLCRLEVFAVDAIVTKAAAYACDEVGCGGASASNSGAGSGE